MNSFRDQQIIVGRIEERVDEGDLNGINTGRFHADVHPTRPALGDDQLITAVERVGQVNPGGQQGLSQNAQA